MAGDGDFEVGVGVGVGVDFVGDEPAAGALAAAGAGGLETPIRSTTNTSAAFGGIGGTVAKPWAP